MIEFKPGDKVRIPAVENVEIVDEYRPGVFQVRVPGEGGDTMISVGRLEMVQPAIIEDASKDRPGMIRKGWGDNPDFVKVRPNTWFTIRDEDNLDVIPFTDAEVVLRTSPPELWSGHAAIEPPSYVQAVRDREGDILRRVDDGWHWDWDSPIDAEPWSDMVASLYEPYIEVR